MSPPEIFAAPWLGHGRAIELALASIHGLTGFILLAMIPANRGLWMSPITADLVWFGYGHLLALPFLVTAALKGLGLYLNATGHRHSRPFRVAGAMAGGFLWVWYLVKFALILVEPSLALVPLEVTLAQAMVVALCLTGSVFSVRIMAMAFADLPSPGAPGKT